MPLLKLRQGRRTIFNLCIYIQFTYRDASFRDYIIQGRNVTPSKPRGLFVSNTEGNIENSYVLRVLKGVMQEPNFETVADKLF